MGPNEQESRPEDLKPDDVMKPEYKIVEQGLPELPPSEEVEEDGELEEPEEVDEIEE